MTLRSKKGRDGQPLEDGDEQLDFDVEREAAWEGVTEEADMAKAKGVQDS